MIKLLSHVIKGKRSALRVIFLVNPLIKDRLVTDSLSFAIKMTQLVYLIVLREVAFQNWRELSKTPQEK